MYCVILALVLAAPQAPSAPQAPTPEVRSDVGYDRLYERAVEENRPLVVWVGTYDNEMAARMPKNYLHYRCDSFPEATHGSIVIGIPAGGWLRRYDYRSAREVMTTRTVRSQVNC